MAASSSQRKGWRTRVLSSGTSLSPEKHIQGMISVKGSKAQAFGNPYSTFIGCLVKEID